MIRRHLSVRFQLCTGGCGGSCLATLRTRFHFARDEQGIWGLPLSPCEAARDRARPVKTRFAHRPQSGASPCLERHEAASLWPAAVLAELESESFVAALHVGRQQCPTRTINSGFYIKAPYSYCTHEEKVPLWYSDNFLW